MNNIYDNALLEAKLTELLNSRLEVRSLMSVDDSLTESAGLTKIINRYTYNGTVEQLESGAANSAAGYVTFTPASYTVKRYQQTFRYNDTEAMQDPALIDMALAGAADVMANQIRTEYFAQLSGISNRHPIAGDTVTYTDIVEALSDIGREVEDGLFILMGTDARAAIRKDPDFIAAHQGEILYTGQFGTLCGIPVLFSKLVPNGQVIITDRAAVKFFVKKEAGLEQSRDIETKDNTIVYERHGIIALVDDTSSVILGKSAPTLNVPAEVSDGTAEVSVTERSNAAGTLCYKLNAGVPFLGDDVSDWDVMEDNTQSITCPSDATSVCVAETDENGRVIRAGIADLMGA